MASIEMAQQRSTTSHDHGFARPDFDNPYGSAESGTKLGSNPLQLRTVGAAGSRPNISRS
jgi:hypothetical protein